ncbi:MAG: hypothetical protein AAGJ28_16620 [Pseudomonadota bacterium]
MLQDKRTDLDAERQKKLLQRLLSEVSSQNPDLYYQSTSQIARQIADHITSGAVLHGDDRALMERLSQRDIEVLLSLH